MADAAVELLLKLKADATDARQVMAGLREQYGRDFMQLGKLGEGAFRGINQEIVSLSRSIPVLGRPIAGITQAFLSMRPPLTQVNDEVRKLTQASSLFESAIVKAFSGGSHQARELATTFERLGIDLDKGIRAPQGAFATFIQSFRAIPNEADRAALAVEVFGAKATQLLPALEGVAAESTAAGAGIAAMVGPIGLAVAGFALLTGGVALLVGGLFKATNSAADYGAQIWDVHLKTGIAVESLTGYYLAAQRAKVPFDQFAMAIARVERSAVEAELGNRKLKQAFDDIGVSTKTALTDTTKFIEEFSTRMGNLPDGAQKVDEAFKLVSRSGANLIPAFDAAKKGVDSLIQEADRLGLKLTEQQARDFKAYQISIAQMQASWKGFEVTIGKDFAPVAREVIQQITSLSIGYRQLIPTFRLLGEAIAGDIIIIKLYFAALETIPTALKVVGGALAATSAVFVDLGQAAFNVGSAIVSALSLQPAAAVISLNAALKAAQDAVRHTADIVGASYQQIRSEFNKNLQTFNADAPEIPEGGTEGADLHGTGRQKKDHTAEKEARDRIKALEDERKETERQYALMAEAEKKAYENRRLSLIDFDKKSVDEHIAALNAKLEILQREEDSVNASVLPEEEKSRTLEEIRARRQEAEDEFEKKGIEAAEFFAKERERIQKEHEKNLLELEEQSRRSQQELNNRLAEEGAITYREAIKRQKEAEKKVLAEQQAQVNKALFEAEQAHDGKRLMLAQDANKKLLQAQDDFDKKYEVLEKEGDRKDLERLQQRLATVEEYYRAARDAARRGEEILLQERERRGTIDPISAIRERNQIQRDEIKDRFDAERDSLEQQKALFSIDEESRKRHANEIIAINAKLTALARETALELLRINQEEQREIERAQPNSKRSLFGDSFADGYKAYVEAMRAMGKEASTLKATLAGLANTVSEVFGRMSDEAGNFTSSAVEAFQTLQGSLRGAIESYVTLGNLGGLSLRKLLAEMAAHFAGAWGMKALDLLAESFADEAKASAAAASGNWIGAALYKKAAHDARHAALIYGAASIGSAVAGRFIAGGSGSGGGSGTAEGGGSNAPQYAPFTYSNNAGIPASQAYGAGSRNLSDALNAHTVALNANTQEMKRINGIPIKEFMGRAAQDAPMSFGDGLQEALQRSHRVNKDIASIATNGTTSHA